MLSVLVVSPAPRFLEALGGVLRDAGMWAVCVERVDDAMQAVATGFRPQAVVVDPTAVLERGGDVLCGYLAGCSALDKVPVLSVSGAVRRREVAGLLARLCELGDGASRACT